MSLISQLEKFAFDPYLPEMDVSNDTVRAALFLEIPLEENRLIEDLPCETYVVKL